MITSCCQSVTPLSCFVNYCQFKVIWSRIPVDSLWNFDLYWKHPFTLQKLKTELKDLYHYSHTIALRKVLFLPKNANIRKIKRALVLKGTFLKTKYVCVLTYQISSSWHIFNRFRQGEGVVVITPPSTHSKQTPKKSTQAWVKFWHIIWQVRSWIYQAIDWSDLIILLMINKMVFTVFLYFICQFRF